MAAKVYVVHAAGGYRGQHAAVCKIFPGHRQRNRRCWRGCEGCINVDVLHRTGRKYCICTGMLYDPEEYLPAKIPADVLERIRKIDGKSQD